MKEIIVGMGEVLWDMLPEGKKIGGAPANFAYHVSQFGLDSCVISAVGNDDLGAEILKDFDSRNLKYLVPEVEYPTGTVDVTLDSAGVPEYSIKEGVAWDNIPFSKEMEDIARCTKAVCFGSLAQRSPVSRNTIGKFLDCMPDTPDTLRVFDINLRQNFYSKDLVGSSMIKSNVLKINDEELEVVSEMFCIPDGDMESQCRELLGRYRLKMLILTCGTKGSYVFTDEGTSYQPTPKVNVADTVGAGDSFTAAFISSFLKGRSVYEAHRRAVEVSAFVCSCNGAMPELPPELTI